MTQRTLTIHIEPMETMWSRTREAARRLDHGDAAGFGEHLTFRSWQTFLSALSPKRWELLGHLHKGGPTSIRALAAAAGRDYKSVHGDLARLMELGLVAKRSDGRVEAPYDRLIAELTFGASLAA